MVIRFVLIHFSPVETPMSGKDVSFTNSDFIFPPRPNDRIRMLEIADGSDLEDEVFEFIKTLYWDVGMCEWRKTPDGVLYLDVVCYGK
jgi:hypothetical protein